MDMDTLGYFIFMDEQEKKAQQQEDDSDSRDDDAQQQSRAGQVRPLRFFESVYSKSPKGFPLQ